MALVNVCPKRVVRSSTVLKQRLVRYGLHGPINCYRDNYLLGNAMPRIMMETVKFSGGLRYDKNGKLYRNVDNSQVEYVGRPSRDMDRVWDDLIEGERHLCLMSCSCSLQRPLSTI